MTFIFKSAGAVRHDGADISAADDAQTLAGDLDPIELRLRPFAGLGGRVGRGMCRARASIKAMACSAVVMAFPNGVFMTMMPRAVAALTSTLSTPMPARPMTLSRFAAATTFSVALVAERTARPS